MPACAEGSCCCCSWWPVGPTTCHTERAWVECSASCGEVPCPASGSSWWPVWCACVKAGCEAAGALPCVGVGPQRIAEGCALGSMADRLSLTVCCPLPECALEAEEGVGEAAPRAPFPLPPRAWRACLRCLEYQRFFTWLSFLFGMCRAMSAHLLPNSFCSCSRSMSSWWVHCRRLSAALERRSSLRCRSTSSLSASTIDKDTPTALDASGRKNSDTMPRL